MLLFAFQQFSGINAIVYFSSSGAERGGAWAPCRMRALLLPGCCLQAACRAPGWSLLACCGACCQERPALPAVGNRPAHCHVAAADRSV